MFGIPWWVILIVVIVVLMGTFVVYMSWRHDELKKLGFDGPKSNPILGDLKRGGFLPVQVQMYKEYKAKRVYSMNQARTPTVMVSDPDIIKDIMVKHFNCFTNRRKTADLGGCLSHIMTRLEDDHWKHVRNTVSPTFSTAKIRLMSKHVEATSKVLVENLTEKMESNKEVELKDIISCFTLDVIAAAGFGVQMNSTKDPNNQFAKGAKNIMSLFSKYVFIIVFMPFLMHVLKYLGMAPGDSDCAKLFESFVDKAMASRRQETGKKRNDFLQLLVNAEDEDIAEHDGQTQEEREALKTDMHGKGLTKLDIQGQAIVFILAGFDTVATALSFTMFLLATHPEAAAKLQKELDEKLCGSPPNYENVQGLAYLEMCVNESLRMFPPAFVLDRMCGQDVEIQGIKFPKGYLVSFPVYSIHHDPSIWPDPMTFDPERFNKENKANRHPYAYIPFGYGPRNCIGMRLALLEVKIALAAVLQVMTPVTCAKTVYPVKIQNLRMGAEDGLWVKFERRKGAGSQ